MLAQLVAEGSAFVSAIKSKNSQLVFFIPTKIKRKNKKTKKKFRVLGFRV